MRCDARISLACNPDDQSQIEGVCYKCYAQIAYETDNLTHLSADELSNLTDSARKVIEHRHGAFQPCAHCGMMIRPIQNRWADACPSCSTILKSFAADANIPRERESGSGSRENSIHYERGDF